VRSAANRKKPNARADASTRGEGGAAGEAWLREAIAKTRDELALFAWTLRTFCLQPHRFGAEWPGGARKPLNPLGFLATSLAAVSVTTDLVSRILSRGGGTTTLLAQMATALGPYFTCVLVALVCHAGLLGVRTRRRLGGTLAMALYTGGGPVALFHVLTATAMVAVKRFVTHDGSEALITGLPPAAARAIYLGTAAAILGMALPFALSLASLHRISRTRAATTLAAAVVATALLFGRFPTLTKYLGGVRLVILASRGSDGALHWHWDLWM
jgi:hypothetical protein